MNIQPEKAYDDIADLAALICDTSVALVSLTDDGRQRFKSQHGVTTADAPQAVPFCEQTIAQPRELFVVPDAEHDQRFASMRRTIDGMPIRFYAGAALITSGGDAFGTLCVIDQKPRQLSDDQRHALLALSRQVVAQVELTHAVEELENNTAQLRTYQSQLEEYHQKLELTNARLRTLSVTDDLTGLSNRFAFEEDLRNAFDHARQSNSPLSLLFLDTDHFKFYNDEFGHPAGDDALRFIAGYLKESMRAQDFVARIGGDEFVIILPGTTRESAAMLAERCRKTLAAATWPKRPLTFSIGISSLEGRKIKSNKLVSEADQALYRAKARGRNQVSRDNDMTDQDLLVNANYVPRVPAH
jgi:diguanylate cyclase (GGDEF)-like protein